MPNKTNEAEAKDRLRLHTTQDEDPEFNDEEHQKKPKKYQNTILMIIFLICVTILVAGIIFTVVTLSGSNSVDYEKSLNELITNEWEYMMQRFPETATDQGDKRYNSKLTNMTETAILEHQKHRTEVLQKINQILKDGIPYLKPASVLNAKLFQRILALEVARYPFKDHFLLVSQMHGPQLELPLLTSQTPFETVKDFDDFILRLSAIDEYITQIITLMRKGIEQKITMPKINILPVIGQIEAIINIANPTDSAFYVPFKKLPTWVSPANRTRLQNEAQTVIQEEVIPAYKKLNDFLKSEYLPAARTSISVSSLPQGREYYKALIEYYTTTNRTADEIHQIGLTEVDRIYKEMTDVMRKGGFNGTFAEYLEFLRSDPQFYAKTREEFLMFIRDICKRADPELVKLFSKLPRCPYGVVEIAEEEAKTAPAAYYYPPTPNCTRPGNYFVNTYNLTSRPKFVYQSTTLHETVPGHHLQMAIEVELEGIPQFRKMGFFVAFVEGWALYAESLGETMGFYEDQYFKFGSLGDEMLRACRLVVDTGIHWLNWTREQAIQFMSDNTPMSILDITSEVDRYIAWPGQALAYKLGQLKIKELKERSQNELGELFNIKEFHDTVLSQGSVSLDILEEIVQKYISSKKQI